MEKKLRTLVTETPEGNYQYLHNMTGIDENKCVYFRDHNGEGNLDLVEYCKRECKERCNIKQEGTSEDFAENMACDCSVALLYHMAIGHAELRYHLGQYEATGLQPDEIKKPTTKDLFSQLQDKLIIELKENEILCPECRGLRFILVEEGNKAFIESCRRCHTGKQYVCKYCGKGNMTDHCECKEARQERQDKFDKESQKALAAAYEKAEKVSYKDYDGYFILPHTEVLQSIEDVGNWIYDRLAESKDVPEYLWAVEGEQHFSIDLQDVISEKCEDGYEDMYENLDTKSTLLAQAQELIKQWEDEQGDSLRLFTETHKKAVIIKDLIEEVRAEMAGEKQVNENDGDRNE